ncbi:MAG TPA: mersacidin/lichenicidin family type 2 lantibiotic [Thermoanaerobaculia bacterium]|nr:mersacidin/lichenicidin family type 2 lantibiotic [Thermoanaerobaculia bacterium]
MINDSNDIIRYWKDARFRETSAAVAEPNPAGALELDDNALNEVAGSESASTEQLLTFGCCTFGTWNPLSPLDSNGIRTYGCCQMEDYLS